MQPALMQATSRESLVDFRAELDQVVIGQDARQSYDLADELFSVAQLLSTQIGLRRALGDAAAEGETKVDLANRVLTGKISDPALQLVVAAVSLSWSVPGDLIDALIEISRQSALAGAETDGSIDDVEDEMFRFGRILQANGGLEQSLGQGSVGVEQRMELLHNLIGNKVTPVTARLLQGAITAPRGQSVFGTVEGLVDLAARRRARSVAIVTAPTELTDKQQQRLADSLSRIYGRNIAISVNVDRSVIGGLKVQVGDDLIDGTVAHRLNQARRRFAG